MRRSVRSLVPTIAVFLASIQAARAGAGVEAGTVPTPAHHRGATNGPVRPAAPYVRASTFAVGTAIVAASAVARRTNQAASAISAAADPGQQAQEQTSAGRIPLSLAGSLASGQGATSGGRLRGMPLRWAMDVRHATLGRGHIGTRSGTSRAGVPSAHATAVTRTSADVLRRTAALPAAEPGRVPSESAHLYGTVRARAPCRGSRGA
jgi:hypothetical protein